MALLLDLDAVRWSSSKSYSSRKAHGCRYRLSGQVLSSTPVAIPQYSDLKRVLENACKRRRRHEQETTERRTVRFI